MASGLLSNRADERPRIYLRENLGRHEASRSDAGPWTAITSLQDAIEKIGGQGLSDGKAVIFWEGSINAPARR